MAEIREVVIDLDRFRPRNPTVVEPVESEAMQVDPPEITIEPAQWAEPARAPGTYTTAICWKVKPSKELAFCRDCGADRPMLWKPPERRGKRVGAWFVCAECGGERLTFKMLSYEEAVRRNRRERGKAENGEVPF